jgi:hypothetical protein
MRMRRNREPLDLQLVTLQLIARLRLSSGLLEQRGD